jgi:hypothetical protein
MKLVSIVEITMLIIYHQGTQKIWPEGPRFLQNMLERFYVVICMQFTLKMILFL